MAEDEAFQAKSEFYFTDPGCPIAVRRVAAANAAWMCSRRTGIGADSLVLIYEDAAADARIQTFGPTGIELISSADAARLAAEYLFQ